MQQKRIKTLKRDEIEEAYEEYYYDDELYVNYLDDYYGIVHIWGLIDLDNLPDGVSYN